jgi:ribosomal protein S18 acetylase RimI-like enzyme
MTALAHRTVRAATSVSRHGLRGTAERAWRFGVTPLLRRMWLRERHVWVDVKITPEPAPLPDGYALRRGGEDDLAALAAIGGIDPHTARRYLDRDAELYVALHGDELAFSTWVHVASVPALAARNGELSLPEGTVSIEDSIAARDHRRGGIASATIDHVTAIQHRRGIRSIISRIAVDNEPARAWSRKIGSTEVAIVSLRRIGPWRRVTIEPLPGGERMAALLAAGVGRR